MSFFDQILQSTAREIAVAEKQRSVAELKRMIPDAPPLTSFRSALRSGFGIIAELKRRSPSAGEMRPENFENAPLAYAKSPIVKAVSVLTNATHFGMGIDELTRIRPLVRKPVLRKEFILKEYQVYEARAFGADAILLMANVLDAQALSRLFDLARELGIDVLFEVHERAEIEKIPSGAQIYGVNSRKFKHADRWRPAKSMLETDPGASHKAADPSVDLQIFSLIENLPRNAIKVAESGVKPAQADWVRQQGYDSILIGTSLLKDPAGIESALSQFEQTLARA
jgi:indole-3-glycerol phosphate synthase